MRTKGLATAIAALLATTATLAVYLYVRGASNGSTTQQVSVVVSNEDIPVGTNLSEAIGKGVFKRVSVGQDSVVSGAVTDVTQLKGHVASSPILAGEQIPMARVTGELPGGNLGIPAGYRGMSLALDPSEALNGNLHAGDHVTLFGTFDESGNHKAATAVLVPDSKVLQVTDPASSDSSSSDSTITVTLALTSQEAQKVAFADVQGTVVTVLLPPGETGKKHAVISLKGVEKR